MQFSSHVISEIQFNHSFQQGKYENAPRLVSEKYKELLVLHPLFYITWTCDRVRALSSEWKHL